MFRLANIQIFLHISLISGLFFLQRQLNLLILHLNMRFVIQNWAFNYSRARKLCATGIFCIALLTYLLTVEPTASFWDCPEYIAVATGMQPGHPPGNPVWMLVARFFINFAPEPQYRALAVNIMSAVCAALTVLVLFLSIEIMTRRLSATKKGSPLCLGASATGALALCWSDSFWFSAVEAEVYAFSSLCTALLLYIALFWLERRDRPHSDRYLILIAYLTGLSLGVHELNLLCLPALLLVVAFGTWRRLSAGRLLLILTGGLGGIALILYGFIPGFMKLASVVELWCVNGLALPFNTGLMLTWSSVFVLLTAVSIYLHHTYWTKRKLLRVCRLCAWSTLMLFIGFSSYALIIIRSGANPPIDTGHPSNIVAFTSYFSRDQYGKSPLVYGTPFTASPVRQRTLIAGTDQYSYSRYALCNPKPRYEIGMDGMPHTATSCFATREDSIENARLQKRGGDRYQCVGYSFELSYPPELSMWFPRMHSHDSGDIEGYLNWLDTDMASMDTVHNPTLAVDEAGRKVSLPADVSNADRHQVRPTYMQNLQYFAVYQCGFMYWRYFLWNFAGRQNDYYGHGEPDAGNFITGIDPLDNLMLDVTADAPANAGRGNKGRNVYFLLPLALGVCGIIYQLRSGQRGRRQALMVFTLFILTGIAIVVYLNQGPVQARDRDYAFLGSYYAFAIWIGMGTLLLARGYNRLMPRRPALATALATATALCVPLQMLSQTADDHDRSGRTATTDHARNTLSTLDRNAIIFAADDNNIFPLWYMIETEEYRTDVRAVSLPYVGTPWYTTSLYMPMRESAPVSLTMPKALAASARYPFVKLGSTDLEWTPALAALKRLYSQGENRGESAYPILSTPRLYFVMNGDTVRIDLRKRADSTISTLLNGSDLIVFDILATNAASSSPRPVYWAGTAANSALGGQLTPYIEHIGTVARLNPAAPGLNASRTASLAFSCYRYGGASLTPSPYFDPVAASVMADLRTSLLLAANALSVSSDAKQAETALRLTDKALREVPPHAIPFTAISRYRTSMMDSTTNITDEASLAANIYMNVAKTLNRPDLTTKADTLIAERNQRIAAIKRYREALRPAFRPFISTRLAKQLPKQ